MAILDINLKVVHIEGKSNSIADAIPRNFLQILRREAPKACVMPDRIPMPLSMAPVNHKTAGLDLCQLEGIAEELCQASLKALYQHIVGRK